MTRLLQFPPKTANPINVVHGGMEYLLNRKPDRETRRSLSALRAQAEQLIVLVTC
ncbi:hypothetical protein [Petrachloros mirabilis]